jgi:uncharacterized membrane protein
MKDWLIVATENAVIIFDAMALMVIVIGSIEVFFGSLWVMLSSRSGHEVPYVWLRYARWLVAGLTFQLAADIIDTSITTGWDAIGRTAAVAAIRTFLNYFLERDLGDVRERQREVAPTITN